MKHIALLFVLAFVLQSCASQLKEVISKSTIRLEGSNTKIRDLIDIDGFYPLQNFPNWGSIMFFEDGTWTYFHFRRGISMYNMQANMTKSIDSWTEDEQTRWGTYWGIYTISGDTIIVNTYEKGSFWKGWSLVQKRYKIINKQIIQEIYYKSLLESAKSYYVSHSPWTEEPEMHFVPADSLFSSNCWLKENKWIWRNESDWRNYMEMIKQKKASFKKK